MIFATCGFQSGALEYARSHGIATIAFVEGSFLYETKAAGPTGEPPAWLDLPKYAGIFMSSENGAITCTTIDAEHPQALSEWLRT